MGARVDLRSGFGFHGGDGDEVAAAVEVVLYGARDEERVDAMDNAVGSGQGIRVGDTGRVDIPVSGINCLEREVLILGEGSVSGRSTRVT